MVTVRMIWGKEYDVGLSGPRLNIIVLASSGTVGAMEGLLVVESQRQASCLDACAGEAGW